MSLLTNRRETVVKKASITALNGANMVKSEEDELPSTVANVSREDIRKYAQCKRVGNYLLGRTVGEGSFAKVKEAFHVLTGEKVAIKMIDKNRARKDRYVSKNMRREARLLQMIRHPHIVQLLEIVETGQCYYLVFEFADGGDLMDYIVRRRKLDEEEVRKFTRQIISAIEYLHRIGIIHRDLKVENLLLDADKNIKIIDFGLSNTIYSQDPHTENHCSTQCGSPAYAAPELLVRKDYGPQIDVWSIGVNLYAMLTGRLPYTIEPFNITTLYSKMLKRQMNPVPKYLSEACKDMIHGLLNPDPKERLNILGAARHPWITADDPIFLAPCPNYLCEEDLDDRILDHVEEQLQLNVDDVIRDVIQNKATKNSCVYHLLVRRLQRYEKEKRKLICPKSAVKATTESEVTSHLEYKSPKNDVHENQKKESVKQSSPKTGIMENPFKCFKTAMIGKKKALKNNEKSQGTNNAQTSASVLSTNPNVDIKNKLCTVKRVALVKVSPARRCSRYLASSSRYSMSSPRTGRRKGFIEGNQQRRKSLKVRRRRAQHDDSTSSAASTPRRTSMEISRNLVIPSSTCHKVRDKQDLKNFSDAKRVLNNEETKRQSGKTEKKEILVQMPEKMAHIGNGDNSKGTITHLYTEKGVVLKRGTTVSPCMFKREQAGRQHHIFQDEGALRINADAKKDHVVFDGEQSQPENVGSKDKKTLTEGIKESKGNLSHSTTCSSQRLIAHTPDTTQNYAIEDRQPSSMKNIPTKIPLASKRCSPISQQSPLPTMQFVPRTLKSQSGSTKTQSKNEMGGTGNSKDKCVSVVVVNRSEIGGIGAKYITNTTAKQKFTREKNLLGEKNFTENKNFTGEKNFIEEKNFTGNKNFTGEKNFIGVKNFSGNKNLTGQKNFTEKKNSTRNKNFTGEKHYFTGEKSFSRDKNFTADKTFTGEKRFVGNMNITRENNFMAEKNFIEEKKVTGKKNLAEEKNITEKRNFTEEKALKNDKQYSPIPSLKSTTKDTTLTTSNKLFKVKVSDTLKLKTAENNPVVNSNGQESSSGCLDELIDTKNVAKGKLPGHMKFTTDLQNPGNDRKKAEARTKDEQKEGKASSMDVNSLNNRNVNNSTDMSPPLGRSTLKSRHLADTPKSWTNDERRKISNYKKTENEKKESARHTVKYEMNSFAANTKNRTFRTN